MSISARDVCIRALNYWRPYHLETYLGIRFIAESNIVSSNGDWLRHCLTRKLETRQGTRGFYFPRYKGLGTNGNAETRDFTASSPINALGEALVLHYMRDAFAFRNRDFVYSYLWPENGNSHRIFDHYMRGYSRRNSAIRKCLTSDPEKIVLIADIRQFYPSISREYLKSLVSAIPRDQWGRHPDLARKHFDIFLETAPGKGLPIGPATSHLLANLALEQLDSVLSGHFPEHYFRYVDDIALVIRESEITSTLSLLRDQLGIIGLTLNETKTDVVPAKTWIAHCPQYKYDKASFDALLTTATLSCALDPAKAESLSEVCREMGLLLPNNRLRDRSRSNRVRRWLHVLISKELLDTAAAHNLNAPQFKVELFNIRNQLLRDLRNIEDIDESSSPMLQRWRLQKKRYILNRLFYVTPIEELPGLMQFLENEPELTETRALLIAAINRTAAPLLEYPGPAVAAFCAVASNLGTISIKSDRLSAPTSTNIAVIATMLTAGAINLEADFDVQSKTDRRLIDFSQGRSIPRTEWNIDFLYELESLRSGYKASQINQFLTTRFDWNEDLALEALFIGGDTYYPG